VVSLGGNLKRLGKVQHISASTKNVIVRSLDPTRVGARVFDSEMKKVGVVFDVFGPVSSAYVSIKPQIQKPEKLVKQTLFLFEKSGKKR